MLKTISKSTRTTVVKFDKAYDNKIYSSGRAIYKKREKSDKRVKITISKIETNILSLKAWVGLFICKLSLLRPKFLKILIWNVLSG